MKHTCLENGKTTHCWLSSGSFFWWLFIATILNCRVLGMNTVKWHNQKILWYFMKQKKWSLTTDVKTRKRKYARIIITRIWSNKLVTLTNGWPTRSNESLFPANGWSSHLNELVYQANGWPSHSNELVFQVNGWPSHSNELVFQVNGWPSRSNGCKFFWTVYKWL